MRAERLFDFLDNQATDFPLDKMVGIRDGNGLSFYSTHEFRQTVDKLSSGLIDMGVLQGDKVGLVVSRNRPEWLIVDLAVQQIGAILVPVYPTISLRDYEYIFSESKVAIVFTEGGDLLDKMIYLHKRIPSLDSIICFDDNGQTITNWKSLLDNPVNQKELDNRKDSITKDDLATIIYTSGTTGDPKGVMLSHWNIVSNVLSAYSFIPCKPGDRVMSFLPLCHIFEKVVTYAYLAAGVSIVYTGLDNLGGEKGDLKHIRPHFFTAVPRLLEKVYEKIMEKANGLTGFKRKLFFWALELTDDYEYDKVYTGMDWLKRKVADILVFSKWRKALGGRVLGILTGAAACPPHIIRVFSAAGVQIREGYGLTEAGPGISFNRYDKGTAMIGTVGTLLDNVEVKIDDNIGDFREGEGEILASGPNIMSGYFNQPEKTREVFTEIDGKKWLRTGDVGRFIKSKDGKLFLKITDRKKELLKTSGGKYVAPTPIENALKQDRLVENVMVVGEQKKFVSALIVPALDILRDWCKDQKISWTTSEDILNHPKVVACFQDIVEKYNKNLARFEQIKRFKLIDAPWEIVKVDGAPGELTPTLKLKRRVIMERWKDIIDAMYKE